MQNAQTHNAGVIPDALLGREETVLVIEDDPGLQDTIRNVLEDFNYRPLVADRGHEGVALWLKHRSEISAIISDFNLPDEDGDVVARTIRHYDPRVKIMIFSGAKPGELKRLPEGVPVLPKPARATQIAAFLKQLLET